MTKKIHVHLIDDLDASEASETLRFEVDGRPYEIDLSSHNAQKFRAEIAPLYPACPPGRQPCPPAWRGRKRNRAGHGPVPRRPPRSGVTAGERAATPAVAGLAGPGYGEGSPRRADSAGDVAAGHTPGQESGDEEHAPS